MTETAKRNVFRQSETNPIVPLACQRKIEHEGWKLSVCFSLNDMSGLGLAVKAWQLSVQDTELKAMPPKGVIEAFVMAFFNTNVGPVIELPADKFPAEARMDVTRQFVQKVP
jgi:hypothetical protein